MARFFSLLSVAIIGALLLFSQTAEAIKGPKITSKVRLR